MSVLAEAISVIVPVSVLEQKYPGGAVQYARDCPNRTFCFDDHLTRMGFMAPTDVSVYVDHLVKLGLTYLCAGKAIDFVVVDQNYGPTTPCDWIEGGKHPEGYSAVWMAGTVPDRFCHPDEWTLSEGNPKLIPTAELKDRVFKLGEEGNSTTFLDLKTGNVKYTIRMFREEGEALTE